SKHSEPRYRGNAGEARRAYSRDTGCAQRAPRPGGAGRRPTRRFPDEVSKARRSRACAGQGRNRGYGDSEALGKVLDGRSEKRPTNRLREFNRGEQVLRIQIVIA